MRLGGAAGWFPSSRVSAATHGPDYAFCASLLSFLSGPIPEPAERTTVSQPGALASPAGGASLNASPDKVERNGAAPKSNPASLDGVERGFYWPGLSQAPSSRAVIWPGVGTSRYLVAAHRRPEPAWLRFSGLRERSFRTQSAAVAEHLCMQTSCLGSLAKIRPRHSSAHIC